MDGGEEDAEDEGVQEGAAGTEGERSESLQTTRGQQEHGEAYYLNNHYRKRKFFYIVLNTGKE